MRHELPSVFISYAREDRDSAQQLYRTLTAAGISSWIDTECLQPGERWKTAIQQAIRNSRFFVALLSSHSVSKKGYVQKELRQALEVLELYPESEVFIIPMRLDDCDPGREELRDLNWIDLFPTWEPGLHRLPRFLKPNVECDTSLIDTYFNRPELAVKLCEIDFLKMTAERLQGRHDIEIFLRNCLNVIPPFIRSKDQRLRNIETRLKDFSACLELHYVVRCGDQDPETTCLLCHKRGSIIHGTIDIGGKSPSDYNDNYISWCMNCYWPWYYFEVDYLGKGPLKFDYKTNTY
jgi:hypothetical protein